MIDTRLVSQQCATTKSILPRRNEIEPLRFRRFYQRLADLPNVTQDGVPVEILGNIEFSEEIPLLLDMGAEGVGLYRTEFLYLASPTEPSEEDHFRAYKACVEALNGRPLVIKKENH